MKYLSKSRSLVIILAGLVFFSCIAILERNVTVPNDVKLLVKEIELGFDGKVIKKYSTRDVEPTHITVQLAPNSTMEISPSFDGFIEYCEIGDSIIKPAAENFAWIIKPNGFKKKIIYNKISEAVRGHKKFPNDWKNKWPEASEF